MFLTNTNKEIFVPGMGLINEEDFIEKWRDTKGFGGDTKNFSSSFPIDDDLYKEGGDWGISSAKNQFRTMQLENFERAVNQTFYNKLVKPLDMPNFGGGSLLSYMPEVSGLVKNSFGTIDWGSKNLGAEIANAAIGAAIQLLSKIPYVGQILAAVFAVAAIIIKAIVGNAMRKRARRAQAENSFYEGAPDVPRFSKGADELLVDVILESMRNGDWTNLFLPQYNWKEEWAGVLYSDGFGFAPSGKRGSKYGGWGSGRPVAASYVSENDCIGYMPGTQQITGMILGKIPESVVGAQSDWGANTGAGDWKNCDTLWEYIQAHDVSMLNSHHSEDIIDSGDYYPSGAQTMSQLWGHIQMDGNPDLYRINTHYIDRAWRMYCEGAVDYLKSMCAVKYHRTPDQMRLEIKKARHTDLRLRALESRFSCALSYHMGVYRCVPGDLGGDGAEMWPQAQSWSRNKLSFQGSFEKNTAYGPQCWTDMYNGYLKQTIRDLRDRQFDSLSKSLVCAYVRSDYAAFQGDGNGGLRKKLHDMRELLLTRKDQWRYLTESDVPRDDAHNGANWYNQLKSAGAFSIAYHSSATKISANFEKVTPGRLGFEGALQAGAKMPPLQLSGRVPGQEVTSPSGRSGKKSSSNMAMIGLVAAGILFLKSRK
jgi:hypothetical protein